MNVLKYLSSKFSIVETNLWRIDTLDTIAATTTLNNPTNRNPVALSVISSVPLSVPANHVLAITLAHCAPANLSSFESPALSIFADVVDGATTTIFRRGYGASASPFLAIPIIIPAGFKVGFGVTNTAASSRSIASALGGFLIRVEPLGVSMPGVTKKEEGGNNNASG